MEKEKDCTFGYIIFLFLVLVVLYKKQVSPNLKNCKFDVN